MWRSNDDTDLRASGMRVQLLLLLLEQCACESVEVSMAEDKLDSFEAAGGKTLRPSLSLSMLKYCSTLAEESAYRHKAHSTQMTMIKSNLMVMMIWSNYDECELLGC